MCLAIPVRIESIHSPTGTATEFLEAEVDVGGVRRTISLSLTPEATVGDYVYVHTGFAISVVDEAEALESLRLLRELAETYPEEELFFMTGDPPAAGQEGAPPS